MLPPDARVVAAVSGGPDSVCLLQVLREIGANLTGVAHFNHKLRGEESEQDERFVAAMSARFGLPFFRAEGQAKRGNLEQEARRARREFFVGLMRDGVCDRVATGHTRDDQAETVLFRILRGSGLTGLAGIHPVTEDGFVRPLIDVGRGQTREFLRSRSIEWREDSSNVDPRFARNRLRNDLLPQLRREWNPRIEQALAQLGDLAFEEERWWEKSGPLSEPLAGARGSVEFDLEAMQAMPRAMARRVIRRSIREIRGDLRRIEFLHIEQVLEMRQSRLRLPGLSVTKSFGRVRLAMDELAPLEPVEVVVPGTYEQAAIRLEFDETPGSACANLKVDRAATIVLRGWRLGDHYRPVGKSRDHKLKEMFQSSRVPSWQRPRWPILESKGKILWARDFGVSEECSVEDGSGPVLRIWDLSKR
ncbi:MAG: tRNA lysidine(34) synthetase TilS [Acidobacteriia bacterium]|nr:tRNA lysidine(34) synthetase TilS [Terriglobia bacterium]